MKDTKRARRNRSLRLLQLTLVGQHVLVLIGCTLQQQTVSAFFTGISSAHLYHNHRRSAARIRIGKQLLAAPTSKSNSTSDEDEAVVSVNDKSGTIPKANEDETTLLLLPQLTISYDDLRPPTFNLRKESLLFDENAATRQNNNVRRLWLACQKHLPHVVHGTRVDDEKQQPEPLDAIYNMLFVRIPAIVAGLVYCYNLSTGHPLVVDLGDGAFEMNPVLVVAALYILLR